MSTVNTYNHTFKSKSSNRTVPLVSDEKCDPISDLVGLDERYNKSLEDRTNEKNN